VLGLQRKKKTTGEITPQVRAAIHSLPKAELHAHVDGCCSEKLWDEKVGADHNAVFGGGTLREFLDQYFVNQNSLRDAHVSTQQVIHSMVDKAKDDGVCYIEPCLGLRALGAEGPEESAKILKECASYAKEKGVGMGFMLMAHRRNDPDKVRTQMQEILKVADQGAPVVAIGCSGDGNETTLREWGHIWDEVGGRGRLMVVPHAGEVNDGSDAFQDLWDAIAIRPNRVAHGLQAMSDDRLKQYMIDNEVCCDVAITSNELIGGAKPGHHILPEMVRAGIPCSINTDDSLLFGCSMSAEYEKAYNLGMSLEELESCARSSIQYSGAQDVDKQRMLRDVDSWHADCVEEGLIPPAAEPAMDPMLALLGSDGHGPHPGQRARCGYLSKYMKGPCQLAPNHPPPHRSRI